MKATPVAFVFLVAGRGLSIEHGGACTVLNLFQDYSGSFTCTGIFYSAYNLVCLKARWAK